MKADRLKPHNGSQVARPTLFYCRCKPYSIDLQRVAIDNRCVFFGHVIRRPGGSYLPSKVADFIVSPLADLEDWASSTSGSKAKTQYSRNRNFASQIGAGSIVMVPRPAEGVIYCGRIEGPFRVSFNERRWQQALSLFNAASKEDDEQFRFSGEVAQGWDVEEFIALPIPMVPATIRRSLFGRSTYGIIAAVEGERDAPLEEIDALMNRRTQGLGLPHRDWTTDPVVVRKRLSETVTPNLMEALIVSILQLEQPDVSWLGVGGSGDGGIDGISYDANGDVVGLLQCKWKYSGEMAFEDHVLSHSSKPVTRYLAVMFGAKPKLSGADQILDAEWLTDMVIKFRRQLPFALTIRVRADGDPAIAADTFRANLST